MKINNSLPGGYPDIAYRDGFLYTTYVLNGFICVDKFSIADGSVTRIFQEACTSTGFARIKNYNGQILMMYRPGTGLSCRYINLENNERREYPGIFYNWPIAFGLNGYAVNNQDINGVGVKQVQIYDYSGSLVNSIPMVPVSGIARLNDDNLTIVSNNDNRNSQLDAWKLYNPEYAGILFCGANISGGVGVVANNSTSKVFLGGTYTNDPKITQCEAGRWAIITSDNTNNPILTILYDISLEDVGGNPNYNPKSELIAIRAQLDNVISKL